MSGFLHSRTWQSHAGRKDAPVRAISRDEIRQGLLRSERPVPSKLTIKRIRKSQS